MAICLQSLLQFMSFRGLPHAIQHAGRAAGSGKELRPLTVVHCYLKANQQWAMGL